jgi:hypothetical protein
MNKKIITLITILASLMFFNEAKAQCTAQATYELRAFRNPADPTVLYDGFLCSDVPRLITVDNSWEYYDGDGYGVKLVAGSNVTVSILNDTDATSITITDSVGVGGNVMPGMFSPAVLGNTLTFTAPYTGIYTIVFDVDGDCTNTGTAGIGDVVLNLNNSIACPAPPLPPVNDEACNAIALTFGVLQAGYNNTAALTDPRDQEIIDLGYTASTLNNTVWYSFVPASTSDYLITTTSPANGLDMWVIVLEGDPDCNAPFATMQSYRGAAPGGTASNRVTLNAGTTYYFVIDGFSGSVGEFTILVEAAPVLLDEPCAPINVYTSSFMDDVNNLGVDYSGYVCADVPVVQSRYQYWDGDGYWVNLVAGGVYNISINNAIEPTSITITDETLVPIPGAFASAAAPSNSLVFTAPANAKYYIAFNTDMDCSTEGSADVGDVVVELTNNTACPVVPATAVLITQADVDVHAFASIGNTSATTPFAITNTGNVDLHITSIDFGGNTAFSHQIALPLTIAGGDTVELTFDYTAADINDQIATATITHDGINGFSGGGNVLSLMVHGYSYGGNVMYESFENGIPATFGNVDNDGDAYLYDVNPNAAAVSNYTGDNCIISRSWDQNPLTPDNYLISPQIVPSATENFFSFFAAAQDPAYPAENYTVYVSTTTPDIAAFTTVLGTETLADNIWREKRFNLSAYVGQPIYVAIRHHNVTDMFYWKIDDVRFPQAPLGINNIVANDKALIVFPNPTKNTINIKALSNIGNASIEVINSNGAIVFEEKANLLNGTNHTFKLNVVSGLYNVKVISNNKISTYKIVVE